MFAKSGDPPRHDVTRPQPWLGHTRPSDSVPTPNTLLDLHPQQALTFSFRCWRRRRGLVTASEWCRACASMSDACQASILPGFLQCVLLLPCAKCPDHPQPDTVYDWVSFFNRCDAALLLNEHLDIICTSWNMTFTLRLLEGEVAEKETIRATRCDGSVWCIWSVSLQGMLTLPRATLFGPVLFLRARPLPSCSALMPHLLFCLDAPGHA